MITVNAVALLTIKFKSSICEGQPISRKLALMGKELNQLQPENELMCCSEALYEINEDYFELWIMQSYSTRVQE